MKPRFYIDSRTRRRLEKTAIILDDVLRPDSKPQEEDGLLEVGYWRGVRGICLRTARTPLGTRPAAFRPIHPGESVSEARDAFVRALQNAPDCDITVISSNGDDKALTLDDIPGLENL